MFHNVCSDTDGLLQKLASLHPDSEAMSLSSHNVDLDSEVLPALCNLVPERCEEDTAGEEGPQ